MLFTCGWTIMPADEDAIRLLPAAAWKPGTARQARPGHPVPGQNGCRMPERCCQRKCGADSSRHPLISAFRAEAIPDLVGYKNGRMSGKAKFFSAAGTWEATIKPNASPA